MSVPRKRINHGIRTFEFVLKYSMCLLISDQELIYNYCSLMRFVKNVIVVCSVTVLKKKFTINEYVHQTD